MTVKADKQTKKADLHNSSRYCNVSYKKNIDPVFFFFSIQLKAFQYIAHKCISQPLAELFLCDSYFTIFYIILSSYLKNKYTCDQRKTLHTDWLTVYAFSALQNLGVPQPLGHCVIDDPLNLQVPVFAVYSPQHCTVRRLWTHKKEESKLSYTRRNGYLSVP